jgi:ABC-type antimicrobial peptide transport system permease subunit
VSRLLLNLQSALASLRDHQQRALLSALGITVGTLAILLLISISKGVQQDITGQVDSLGVNLLIVVPFHVPDENSGFSFNPNVAGISYLRDSDIAAVRSIAGVKQATPWVFPGGTVRVGPRVSESTLIIATGPEWFAMRPSPLEEGTLLSQTDTNVCVLGHVAKEHLFGADPAVGREVMIGGESYRVSGVLKKTQDESLMSFASLENVLYVPYRHIRAKLGDPPLSRILIQTESTVEPKTLIGQIERTLMQRLDRERFSVITQKDLLRLLYSIMGILTSLVLGLTSIALFVGGVGIMTVMLMSVGERAKEIGIRKTAGATRGDIFAQFLFEALLLSLFGAVMGLALSYGVVVALLQFTKIKPLLDLGTVALGFGVALAVGGVFGLLPAMKAARQDPVTSLRHD